MVDHDKITGAQSSDYLMWDYCNLRSIFNISKKIKSHFRIEKV